MHVKIEQSERTLKFGGLFGKRYKFFFVTVAVEFTELEKYTISELSLERMILLERAPPAHIDPRKYEFDSRFNLTVGSLLNGVDEYSFYIPKEAVQYDEVIEEQLQAFALHLRENAGKSAKRRTFEL